MPDPRFFPSASPMSLGELAQTAGAELAGADETGRMFRGVAPLDSATGDEVSFLANRRYLDQFRGTDAGCCIVEGRFASRAPAGATLLVTEEPYLAYARVAAAFHPDWDRMYMPGQEDPPVHRTAVVGHGTKVALGAVVGPGVEIGEDCIIGVNAYVGEGVRIGDGCRLGPMSSIRCAMVGDRVVLYAGARIGEPGFGIAVSPRGMETIPQLGRVLIGNDVEIGANSTVDRGSGPDTVIGDGCRLDNLVQIGHNVHLGRNCAVAGLGGVAGSSKLGDGVMVGGLSGVSGHLHVGDGAMVAGHSGVTRDVPPGGAVMGTPAVPINQYLRQVATLSRLSDRKEGRK